MYFHQCFPQNKLTTPNLKLFFSKILILSYTLKAALRQSFYACVYCMKLRFQSDWFETNQRNYFENTTTCSKGMRKTLVTTLLYALVIAPFKNFRGSSSSEKTEESIKWEPVIFISFFTPDKFYEKISQKSIHRWCNVITLESAFFRFKCAKKYYDQGHEVTRNKF